MEILGHRDDPGVDILSIVKAFGIPTEFEKRVLDQAQRVSNPVSEADCAGRLDLRNVQMVRSTEKMQRIWMMQYR